MLNLGCAAKKLVDSGFDGTLCLFGGDCVSAALSRMGCRGLLPVREIEPGVVVSRAFLPAGELTLVTKSGGFGSPDVIEKLIKTAEEKASILTNTHITEKTVATVTKVWDDDNDRDGVRPESLTMTLSNGDTAELNADNNWTATIEGLDRFSEGEEIVYTWTEDSIKGYTQVSNVTDGTVTTVTNHHDIAKTSKTVIKIWEDNDDRSGARPESITVWLNKTQKVILNAENNWSATIKDLPLYANGGHKIIYRWTEGDIPGYTLTSKVTTGNTTELTNTLDELEKEYTLTIIYRYPDGSEAAPAYTGTYVAGDGYVVWSPNIDGYVAVPLQVAGTMPEGDITVIVTYMPAGRGVPVGRAPIGGSVGDCIE